MHISKGELKFEEVSSGKTLGMFLDACSALLLFFVNACLDLKLLSEPLWCPTFLRSVFTLPGNTLNRSVVIDGGGEKQFL